MSEVKKDAALKVETRCVARSTRFFLWCAGSDRGVLARVPTSETIKHAGLGSLVLVPAVLALFAMTYALSTIAASPWIYGAGGLLWALIVFCFDRFLVSTFRKSGSVGEDLASPVFLSRLVLAAFVGVTVAHPLVMLYFSDSIDERLALERRDKVAAVAASFGERQDLLSERIEALKSEVLRRETARDALQARLVDEIDGVVSGRTTGVPGRGASAAEKKLQLERAESELLAVRQRNRVAGEAVERQLAQLEVAREEAVRTYRQSRDYLARVGALEALAAGSPHVDRIQWFLIVFFVFVDTLPILFKGLTPAGPYDERLHWIEFRSSGSLRRKRSRFAIRLEEEGAPREVDAGILGLGQD